MSFTGQLGTSSSQLGQLLLGSVGTAALTVSVSDSLNNWQDSTIHILGKLRLVSDTLSFSDATRVVLGLHPALNDNLDNWLDDINVSLPGLLNVSVSDVLNNWDDFVALFKQNTATQQLVYKLNEVNYIRRYLNDVVTEVTDSFSFPSITVYKADEITYIRRYLNDV